MVCFIGDAIEGITYRPAGYLERLIFGRASGPYFFVPLLCQFYLLSPVLVPFARIKGKVLLLIMAFLQLGALSLKYLLLFGAELPNLNLILRVTPSCFFIWWAFYFPFGIVCGFNIEQFKHWLAQYKSGILVASIVLGLLSIVEPEAIYRISEREWRFVPLTLATSLYSVAFLSCFLALDKISTLLPLQTTHQLGKKSYGIYLLHMKVMAFVSRVIRQIAPWMLAHQVLLLQPVVFTFGLGVPLLFMALVARSPARKSYRYLFG